MKAPVHSRNILANSRILIAEDDPDMANLLVATLELDGARVDVCASLDQVRSRIGQFSYDGVLLDLFLGDESAFEILPFLIRGAPFTPIVVMTAHGSIQLAVRSMSQGAASFVSKSESPVGIVDELRTRMEAVRPSPPLQWGNHEKLTRLGFIGKSAPMLRLFDDLVRMKDAEATVLISGESGTGKELVARAVHELSPRSAGIFEAINCAAIPEALLESELFGHVKGAFTDAKSDRKGIFEVCTDGTLFLDEIGELPYALQAKLLRVLQEKEVTPLGSSKTIKVRTRIVAATNRNLVEEIANGKFRQDLFYRLNILPVFLTPLRERAEDIPLLVRSFILKFGERYGKSVLPPSSELDAKLSALHWLGNVRELQNCVERAVILSSDGHLHLEDFMLQQRVIEAGDTQELSHEQGSSPSPEHLDEARETFEKAYLRQILSTTKGSITEAARLAGKYRTDIYRLMHRYGISPNDFR